MKKYEVIIIGSHFDEKLGEKTTQRFHRYVDADNASDATEKAEYELIPQIKAGFYKGIFIINPLNVVSVKEAS